MINECDNTIHWLTRQDYHVIKTPSCFWYNACPGVYQAFPYHKLVTPSMDEIRDLFQKNHMIAIRYSCPVDQKEGQISYHVVFDRDHYELKDLSKKARHDVVKGLDYATYQPISLERLNDEGWLLCNDTHIRQGREIAQSRKIWNKICCCAKGLNTFESWGAIHDEKLVAAILACTIEDTINILYQQSLTEHLKFGVNNALTYVFTHEVLKRPEIQSIFYGLHSLDAPASVDDYKFRMGYFPKPVRQRVMFNPLIPPSTLPLIYSLIWSISKIFSKSCLLQKSEGMFRFYFSGKKDLSKQQWPKALANKKEIYLLH